MTHSLNSPMSAVSDASHLSSTSLVRKESERRITRRDLSVYLINLLKPFSFSVGVMIWTAVLWGLSLSLRPYFMKLILNRLVEGSQETIFVDLAFPVGAYVLISFMMMVSFRLHSYFVEIKMIPPLRQKILQEAMDKLLNKSHAYYQQVFSGSLTNRVNDLTNRVPELIQLLIDHFLSESLALGIALIALGYANPIFAFCMTAWVMFFMISAFFLSRRIVVLAIDWSVLGSVITGKITDIFSNILSVRLFSAKASEKETLNHTANEAVQAEQKLQWIYFWMWLIYGVSFFCIIVLNFYFLCKGRYEGWITVGDFALVLVITSSIVDILWQFTKRLSEFSNLSGRIMQALQSILRAPDLHDNPNSKPLIVSRGEIIFSHVHFHYQGSDILFHDNSVILKAGEKIGLVGYSGSGKTTFVNLILRLYDVTEGYITIDGQDIREVTQKSLRQNIAVIPQDLSLFHRSLMENIRYGRVDATDEEVIAAAKKADAHEFIMALPQGYSSLVGDRGVKLSGGQRQRISIARAILKNGAPILILDEATSQIDSFTERDIQYNLWPLMRGRTTLVIAHRLSTLLYMDRILVFHKGKIIQDGAHKKLVEEKGLYKIFWETQVGGFLIDKSQQTSIDITAF